VRAAAISHLTQAPVDQTAIALGIAATQSSGLRLQFGYDAKPYHAGMAARSGLLAARLAAAGFGGAPDFLDNAVGFHSAYAFGAERPHVDNPKLGRALADRRTGSDAESLSVLHGKPPSRFSRHRVHKEGLRCRRNRYHHLHLSAGRRCSVGGQPPDQRYRSAFQP
jgi:hypothetical protein